MEINLIYDIELGNARRQIGYKFNLYIELLGRMKHNESLLPVCKKDSQKINISKS
jgi:hypothetical protein